MLFFYSGAGGYLKGSNYLMASDAQDLKLETAESTLMPLTEIQRDLRLTAAASVLILDTNFADLDPPKKPAPFAPDGSIPPFIPDKKL